jgi:hypothetical protein
MLRANAVGRMGGMTWIGHMRHGLYGMGLGRQKY